VPGHQGRGSGSSELVKSLIKLAVIHVEQRLINPGGSSTADNRVPHVVRGILVGAIHTAAGIGVTRCPINIARPSPLRGSTAGDLRYSPTQTTSSLGLFCDPFFGCYTAEVHNYAHQGEANVGLIFRF